MPRPPRSGGDLGNWGRGADSGGRKFAANLDAQVREALASGRLVPDRADSPSVIRQLKYLGTRTGGDEALLAAGVPKSTLRRWHREGSRPSGANLERVNRAYWQLRGSNLRFSRGRPLSAEVRGAVAPQVRTRMRGRSITVIPITGEQVHPQAQGAQQVAADKHHTASERTMRPSAARWEAFIDTWATGDVEAMDVEWMDYAGDIDSPPEPYFEVRHVGFMV
ncbi:hypothetical protein NGB36_03820 [Streptomyces sp. RB6PN25]|uniref:Transcriptional regulator n=1 Tax=Streptomyces humicola TaxID=2953240 RepID=A0ABT1PPY2_9ACTN|nr:hypothetical protein [Streptomyces humicola]MCQ4079742.1 hypothetical protein [Streptomyces humicola]